MSETKDVALREKWEVSSNTSSFTLQSVVDQIRNGNEKKGGINLRPFYQREYKFTRKDESLLIESLLGGIPIPVIYMASDTTKIPHVTNVIDGQHRLMAVYRYIENKFKLTGLQKYEELNGLYFRELHPTIQNKLKYQISLSFQLIHTQDDPELEIEIFTRYNQGSNPLTKQEIRHVVFDSIFNSWMIKLIDGFEKNETTKKIFNINTKRKSDKATHQEIYVLFGIFLNLKNSNYSFSERSALAEKKNKKINPYKIKNGINQEFFSSTLYVDEFMRYARGLGEEESRILIESCKGYIDNFVRFLKIVYIDSGVNFPLSKEIYGPVLRKNHKMQTSILMIMTTVFYKITELKIPFDDDEDKNIIRNKIARGFNNSRFAEVITSTTEPSFLNETIEIIMKSIYDEI